MDRASKTTEHAPALKGRGFSRAESETESTRL